jgi:hypothetical protein
MSAVGPKPTSKP